MKLKGAAKSVRMAILGYDGDYLTPSVNYLVRNHSFVAVNSALFVGLG